MRYWYDREFKCVVREPNCTDEWMKQIWEIGCGYDGCNTVESLQGLVDELIECSHKARECLYEGKIFEDKEESKRSLIEAYAERERDLGE